MALTPPPPPRSAEVKVTKLPDAPPPTLGPKVVIDKSELTPAQRRRLSRLAGLPPAKVEGEGPLAVPAEVVAEMDQLRFFRSAPHPGVMLALALLPLLAVALPVSALVKSGIMVLFAASVVGLTMAGMLRWYRAWSVELPTPDRAARLRRRLALSELPDNVQDELDAAILALPPGAESEAALDELEKALEPHKAENTSAAKDLKKKAAALARARKET